MERIKKRPSALFAILTGAAAILSLFVPLIYLILPALFGYLTMMGPSGRLLPAVAIAAAGTLLLGGQEALFMLALYLPAGIAMGAMMRNPGISYRDIVAVCAFLLAVGLYAVLCLPSVLQGMGPMAMLQDAVQTLIDGMNGMVGPNMAQQFGVTESELSVQMAAVTAYLADLKGALPSLLPAVFCGAGCLGSIVCVPLAQRWSLRAGAPLRPMARFSDWQLPKEFVFGALILAVGSLVLSLLKLEIAQSVWGACQVLIGFPLAVQGLCVFLYLMRDKRTGCLLPIVMAAVLLFVPLIVLVALILLGGIEQSARVRKKIADSKNGQKPS